jgi:hypothetical protein
MRGVAMGVPRSLIERYLIAAVGNEKPPSR